MDECLVISACNFREGIISAPLPLRYAATVSQMILFLNLDHLSYYASWGLLFYFSFTHRRITFRMIS